VWLKQIADVTERAPKRIEGSGLGFAQVCLDLGELFEPQECWNFLRAAGYASV